jgi:hypothetical protein
LRHRWFVAQRRSDGAGWQMHDGNYATLHDAGAYVAMFHDGVAATSVSVHEHGRR